MRPVMAEAGPLSPAELSELEATLLPALERHHLRLLAHSLRTLQQIAGRQGGPIPAATVLEAWIAAQPAAAAEPQFQQAFLDQLLSAADQLQAIAAPLERSPLALTLSDLIAWTDVQARARLSRPQSPASPAAPPPG
jgi:hypothetical protein